ncbi:MAG: DUF3568 family protein [Bacillota bacterium]
MKIIGRVVLAGVLGLILVTQSGCLIAAAAAGTGATVAYVKGDLDANVDASPQRTVEATNAAVKDLGFVLVSSNGSAADGEVIARTATDKRVKVTMKRLSEKSSKVTIRVGTWGDEAISVQVLEKIKAHLQTPVP